MFCFAELFRHCCPGVSPDEQEWIELEDIADQYRPQAYEHSVWKAKVVRVLDAGTIQAFIKNEHRLESHRIRLQGIDVPTRPDDVDTELGQQLLTIALGAENALKQKLETERGRCLVMFAKDDKYGRRHALVVARSGENLCDWMVMNGYATRAAPSTPSSPAHTAPSAPTAPTPSAQTL